MCRRRTQCLSRLTSNNTAKLEEAGLSFGFVSSPWMLHKDDNTVMGSRTDKDAETEKHEDA